LVEVPEVQRAAFIGALSGAVAHAQQHVTHLGMLLIDLTNLARINHYHGYRTGDLMLATAYRELLGVSKLPDTVFRVGSHRFAFILPGLTNPPEYLDVDRVRLALNDVHRIYEDYEKFRGSS